MSEDKVIKDKAEVTTEEASGTADLFENTNEAPSTPQTNEKPDEPRVDLPAVDLEKAITPEDDVVEFRSRYAEFSMCMKPPKTTIVDGRTTNVEHGRFINFHDYMFVTRDKEEIDFIRNFVKSGEMGSDCIFELAQLDPLNLGDMFANLEAMTIHQLRAACKSRSIDFQQSHDEGQLRYLIVKHLRGDGSDKK